MSASKILYSSDVATILDCSKRVARTKIRNCKAALKKQRHQYLTLGEFCKYYGIEVTDAFELLGLTQSQKNQLTI